MSKKKIIIIVSSFVLFLSLAFTGAFFGFYYYYYLPKLGEIKALKNDYQDFCQEVQQEQFWEQDFLMDFKAQKKRFLQQNEELAANLNGELKNLIKINCIKQSLNHLKQQFQDLKKKYQQSYDQQIVTWRTEIKTKKKNAIDEAKQFAKYNLWFYNIQDRNKKYFLKQSQVIFNNLIDLDVNLDNCHNLTVLNHLSNTIDIAQKNITDLKTFFHKEQLTFLSLDLISRIEKLSLNDDHDQDLMFLMSQVEVPPNMKNLNVTHTKQQINTILSSINNQSDLKKIKKQLVQQVKQVENLKSVLEKQKTKLCDQMIQKIQSCGFDFDLTFLSHNKNQTFTTMIKKIRAQQKDLFLLQAKMTPQVPLFTLSRQIQLFFNWQKNIVNLKAQLTSFFNDLYQQNLDSFLEQINHKTKNKINFYPPLVAYLQSQEHSWFQPQNFLKDIVSFLLQSDLKIIGGESLMIKHIITQYQNELTRINKDLINFYYYINNVSNEEKIDNGILKSYAHYLNEIIAKTKKIRLTVNSNDKQFESWYQLLLVFDQKKEEINKFLNNYDYN